MTYLVDLRRKGQPPPIRGLDVRLFAGPSDFARLAAVLAASRRADGLDGNPPADLAQTYAGLCNADPARNVVLAEVAGRPVAYAAARWWTDALGRAIYGHWCHVVPEWRERGIGSLLLRRVHDRLHALADDRGAGPRIFETRVWPVQSAAVRLLLHEGYREAGHEHGDAMPRLDEHAVVPGQRARTVYRRTF